MTIEAASRRLVAEFSSRRTLRTGSLITTVFGDSIAPRGGTVWLGSLIAAMACFGINDRLVRTAIFRLAKEGWLDSEKLGRRSFYSLTPDGQHRFEQATLRIYGEPRQNSQDSWHWVVLDGLPSDARASIHRELGWLGFGAVIAVLALVTVVFQRQARRAFQ